MMSKRKWNTGILSFSRSEARGCILLLLLIITLLVIRYYQRKSVGSFELQVAGYTAIENEAREDVIGRNLSTSEEGAKSFTVQLLTQPVDPNTAAYDDLIRAGIGTRAARNVIRYREHGGRFSNLHDLKKIYGIDTLSLPGIEANFIFPVTGVPEPASNPLKYSPQKPDLNHASQEEIEQLPGIGPVLASRIVRFRDLLGGFYSLKQLSEVYGLPDSVQNLLTHSMVIDTLAIRHMDLNTASLEQLQNHPYISRFEAKSILSYRNLKGNFTEYKQLIDNNLIRNENYNKLKPYLRLNEW